MSSMSKPKIRFNGFTEDWEQRKFGTMFKRRMERNNGQFDNTRWISVAKMYFQEPDKVTSNNIDTRTYVMRRGDIAFEGHSNAEYKYGRFVANDIGDGIISELFPIYMHIDDYDEAYWKYVIQIEEIMASKLLKCIEISYTSSNKLDEAFFLKEEILVPSLDEQQQIGNYFRKLDQLITLHQRKCEQTKKLKKFMLQKMFPQNGKAVPEIRFNGFTEDWEQRKLGEVFQEYSKKNHPELQTLTIIQGSGTVFREESDRNLQYDKSSLSGYKMVCENDFIVHLRSFEGGLEKSNHNGLISPAYHTFHGDNVDSRFYYSYFRSYEFIKHKLVPHVYGIRDGRSIDIDGMKTIKIPYTSYDEQKKIGDYIESLDHLITLHQRKCDELQNMKKFMLQNMFV
ncbi:MAG: restriction endonuclease subunit S [Lachnospiraceae bacterium]|nr:restriction endonuclease subunit S [Lachnospiraceae bacterium]